VGLGDKRETPALVGRSSMRETQALAGQERHCERGATRYPPFHLLVPRGGDNLILKSSSIAWCIKLKSHYTNQQRISNWLQERNGGEEGE
jgi:hypothetical protein